jgi:selenocysteine-specific elongation factor
VTGGPVLDAAPKKQRWRRGPRGLGKLGGTSRDAVEQMFAKAGGAPQAVLDIARKLGRGEPEVVEAVTALVADGSLISLPGEKPERYLHRSATARLSDGLVAAVRSISREPVPRAAYSTSGRISSTGDAPTLRYILDALIGDGILVRKDAEIGLAGREAQADPAAAALRSRIAGAFRAARFSAPLEDDVRTKLGLNPSAFNPVLSGLLRSGELVRLGPKVVYHRDTVEAARAAVGGLIERRGSVTIAELRDRLELSRKYAQAILEYFDKTGFTKRVEDRHVPTKRLAA